MRALRRAAVAAGLVVAILTGLLAITQQPAQAATTWYLATTGSNANACTTPAAPCATVPGVLAKPAFASGDTINVAPGDYPMTLAAQRATVTRSVTIQRDPSATGEARFDGGGVAGGSLFVVNGAGVQLTLRDLTIRRGAVGTSGFGAGLLVFNGSALAEDVAFDLNTSAAGWGGAVAVWPGATFQHDGGRYFTNSAANGGAVAVFGPAAPLAAATASFTDVAFGGNTAPGGAVAGGGNGGAIYSSGTTTVTGGTFGSNGVTQSTNGNARRGYGGSIFNGPTDAGDAPVLTVVDSTFGGPAPASPFGTHASFGGAIANVALLGSSATGTTPGHLEAEGVTVTATSALAGGAIYTSGSADLIGGRLLDNDALPFAGVTTTGSGGGIFNAGALQVEGTEIAFNGATAHASTASTGLGGGVYSQVGAVALDGATVHHNTAVSSPAANTGLGGGVFTFLSPLTLTSTDVTDNQANVGGGLYAIGDATIDGGRVAANQATLGGGTVLAGTTTLTGTAVDGNGALSAGGIYNTGTLTGADVEITGNTATATSSGTGLGGGLYNAGTSTLTGGRLAGNTAAGSTAVATGLGGGAFNAGPAAHLTLDQVHVTGNQATGTATFQTGWGGAVYNGANNASIQASLVIERSTLDANTAVTGSAVLGWAPGASSSAPTAIRRSTISGNPTTVAGSGSVVLSTAAPATAVESTLVGDGAHPVLVVAGGTTAGVAGSIVDGAGAPGCSASGAVIGDGGWNLTRGGDASCGFTNAAVSGDPQLAGLATNGGPTPTRLPGPTSPALDRVDPATATPLADAVSSAPVSLCQAPDQRGVARPQGARCDLGAVELGQEQPVLTGPASGTFTVGTAGTLGTYAATGSPTPALSATGLPTGLALVATGPGTAAIQGTPAPGTGGTHTATVTAQNEAGADGLTVTITVNEAPTVAGPGQLHLVETVPGSAAYTSTGFPVPTLSVTGTLPTGISFVPGAGGTGSLTGTPAEGSAGTYTVFVRATNGTGPDAVLSVIIEVEPRLAITTTALPPGNVAVPYGAGVAAAGGTPPVTFAVTAGALPAGLSLGSNGAITGIPTGPPGTSTFTVRATDSGDPAPQTAERELSITIGRGPTYLDVSPVILQRTLLGINIGSVNATLRGGIPPTGLAGQTIVFRAGNTTVCTGVTDATGYVSCSMTVTNTLVTILNLGVTASYAGSPTWQPASGSAGLL